jgi:hypothetical protein
MLERVEGDEVLGLIYRPSCYEHQRNWCYTNVTGIMLGISMMQKLPVDILNREALVTLVSGIDTKQEADFAYRTANSQHFAVVVEPMMTRNDFRIDTIFDKKIRKTYGKIVTTY